MLNKIFIMGRLTRDPELRRTANSTPVTSFSLAVDRDFKSQSGEKSTDFIDVVVDEWGKRRLAYAIDYKTEGYYVLMSFTSAPEFPKELDRILGITEGIMRSMIVCKDE